MKKILTSDTLMNKKTKAFILILAVAMLSLYIAPTGAEAAVSSWQKGASLYPTSSADFSSENFRQSLRDLRATNSNFVTLIIPYYQSNIHSTDIQRGWNTPTDQS